MASVESKPTMLGRMWDRFLGFAIIIAIASILYHFVRDHLLS